MSTTDKTPEQIADELLGKAGITKKAKANVGKLKKLRPIKVGTDKGAILFNDVETFLARFIVYPSEAARVAHVLWIGHTHLMDAWESTPRLAFLGPEPGIGKTRSMEVTELLVPDPVATVNCTPAFVFRKCGSDDGPPTILFDEIDTVFGAKAKEHEELRALLNSGHRRGAYVGRCIVSGKTVLTEEIPSFAAVAMAGIGWLPDTIMSRCVVVRMRRRAPDEIVQAFRRRIHGPQGELLCRQLAGWAETVLEQAIDARPDMPNGIEDRNADCWEALLAVADLAGVDWPERAREAAVALIKITREDEPSLGIRLLVDLHTIFGAVETMSTKDIIEALICVEESPWGDLRGKPLDARGLANILRRYQIKPVNVRLGGIIQKGYRREDLYENWRRYIPSSLSPPETALHALHPLQTPPPKPSETANVADVAHVADFQGKADTPGLSRCEHCGKPANGHELQECYIGSEPRVWLHPQCQGPYYAKGEKHHAAD
jgi:Protein of unknown function (DUF3631)